MILQKFSVSFWLSCAVALVTVLVGSGFAAGPISAQTSSPSAEQSTELRQFIQKQLEKTLEPENDDHLLGVIGSVSRVGSSTFTIVDPIGRERNIVINPETTSFAATAQVKSVADLAIDSGVAIIGDSTDDVLINARRIIPAATPFVENRRVALGSVQSFESNSLTLVERGNGQTTTVDITTTTRFEDILGNTVARSSLQEDESVLLVIDQSANGDLFAKRVRLLVAANAQ